MFEPIRFVQDITGNAHLRQEGSVLPAEEVVFEQMMMEALPFESLDSCGEEFGEAGGDVLPALVAGPEILRSGVRESASKRIMVGTGEFARTSPSITAAYGQAVITAAAPTEEHGESSSRHRLVEWMDGHALTRSVHKCARFVREALDAAGISTADRPSSGSAGDYGPYLMRHGAKRIEVNEDYRPEAGDTAVFESTAEHPFGHIQVYDGEQWVSDFRQKGFSPYRDPATTPEFQVYRLP